MKISFAFCLLIFLLPFAGWSQVYVSPIGSDTAAGTREHPLATVAAALRKGRELRRLNDPAISNGLHITIDGGTYRFYEPLFIRPEDAGTANSPTVIEAMPGTTSVFSGGVPISGWKKLTTNLPQLAKAAHGKLWVADAPKTGTDILDFRQLWINDKKGIRAKAQNGDTMSRILSWNKKDEQCWISKQVVDVSKLEGMEMMIHQWWAIANLRIKSAQSKGDSVLLRFYQPESRIQSEHPWPAPWISAETGNSAFTLSNALAFLDSPGEWYLDKKGGKIYYWPRAGEDLRTASVIAPQLETLLTIQGRAEKPVTHIQVKGISFQHTTWLRPSQKGHVPLQAGMYLLDAYKLKVPGTPEKKTLENQAWVGRPAAAVATSFANNIRFEACRFMHTASTALDFGKGTKQSNITGNLFQDIGGTAILAGVFSDVAMEAHLPYNPADEREITSGITIMNNVVNNAANEDWGCVGIGAGFVRNTTIAHNDLSELPYTGISVGWGWTPAPNVMQDNKIIANKIQRYGKQLYDVAGIYTLSAQPGSIIAENYIDSIYKAPYAHLPSHWFYLYTDEGTAGVTVKNNWTPSQKYLQNANGSGNLWENNGKMVNAGVKAAAGLQNSYRHLLQEKMVMNPTWAINHELPMIIEVVGANKEAIHLNVLKAVLAENGADTSAVYQWQNHTVVFDKVKDASVLRSKIQKAFPQARTAVYYDAFYEFNRNRCSPGEKAQEWDHVLLTANLVANPKLQKEYMDYHATQFQQWPEIAKGFCRAEFQQLLLYRNGRQLMLVISIPKGKSLDELNPKTWENNPRVNEWNKLMAKYQEGIAGTKPGEVWVFLEKVKSMDDK